MILLVDSGATKANWAAVRDGEIIRQTQTQGISPYFLTDEGIIDIAREARMALPSKIDAVYFYSTGCKAEDQRRRMAMLLRLVFQEARLVEVDTDLLAAARSMAQNQPGIVCILGTGSNACGYDGQQIISNSGGLGFILGDEGSGAAIGKEIVKAYLNHEMPTALWESFHQRYHLNRDNILESVYKLPFPNRFLATFAPFAAEYREVEVIKGILNRQFGLFFQRSVLPLEESSQLKIHFVGSVAFYFEPEISTAGLSVGASLGTFCKDPMEGLIKYHSDK
jgi:N-acetylglucosamine kinase-like BadF-type ATPase